MRAKRVYTLVLVLIHALFGVNLYRKNQTVVT